MKTLLYAIGKHFGVYRMTRDADVPPVELPSREASEHARKSILQNRRTKSMRRFTVKQSGKSGFAVFANSKSEARARAKFHLGINRGRLPLGMIVK